MCVCAERRQWDPSVYANEYVGIFFESHEKISVLRSHLIVGYEPLSLTSDYFCRGKCQIRSRLKFVSNDRRSSIDQSMSSMFQMLSLFSCFYAILPGRSSELDLLTFHLIYFYCIVLLLSQGKDFHRLMQIFGLHPIVRWTATLVFHLLLSQCYALIVHALALLTHRFDASKPVSANNGSHLTLDHFRRQTDSDVQRRFFLGTWIVASSTLPFVSLLSSEIRSRRSVNTARVFVFRTLSI